MNKSSLGRLVRWGIWGASAIAAGAMKPLFFPEGGWKYAVVALGLIAVMAAIGILVEKEIAGQSQ